MHRVFEERRAVGARLHNHSLDGERRQFVARALGKSLVGVLTRWSDGP